MDNNGEKRAANVRKLKYIIKEFEGERTGKNPRRAASPFRQPHESDLSVPLNVPNDGKNNEPKRIEVEEKDIDVERVSAIKKIDVDNVDDVMEFLLPRDKHELHEESPSSTQIAGTKKMLDELDDSSIFDDPLDLLLLKSLQTQDDSILPATPQFATGAIHAVANSSISDYSSNSYQDLSPSNEPLFCGSSLAPGAGSEKVPATAQDKLNLPEFSVDNLGMENSDISDSSIDLVRSYLVNDGDDGIANSQVAPNVVERHVYDDELHQNDASDAKKVPYRKFHHKEFVGLDATAKRRRGLWNQIAELQKTHRGTTEIELGERETISRDEFEENDIGGGPSGAHEYNPFLKRVLTRRDELYKGYEVRKGTYIGYKDHKGEGSNLIKREVQVLLLDFILDNGGRVMREYNDSGEFFVANPYEALVVMSAKMRDGR